VESGRAVADGAILFVEFAREITDNWPVVKGVFGGMTWIFQTCQVRSIVFFS
jgi:hypothetical protein